MLAFESQEIVHCEIALHKFFLALGVKYWLQMQLLTIFGIEQRG